MKWFFARIVNLIFVVVLVGLPLVVAAETVPTKNDVAATTVNEATTIRIKGLLKGFDVTEITAFKIPDMFEVVLNKTTIVYVHLPTGLVFGGQVYEGADGTNLTINRANELTRKYTAGILETVDKKNAIKLGNGPVELVQFIDLDSKFSRQVMEYLEDKGDVFTRYIYLLPLKITPKTIAKTQMVFGATDRAAEMNRVLKGEYDEKLPEFKINDDVNNLMSYNGGLMNRYNLVGTPTQVWGAGFMEGFNKGILEKLVKETREKVKK